MTIGPIQMLAVQFEEFEPTGVVLQELNKLTTAGTIRLIDAQFVRKTKSGQIISMEMSGLSPAEQIEFGAVIGGLIGSGIAGEEGAVEGAVSGALAAVEHSYGMTASDVQEVADSLAPGDAAALMLIEHTWATDFRDALAGVGGRMVAQGFLTPDTLFMVGAELEAQAEAMAAIAVSEAIQDEAALEAAEAMILSDAIQQEAAGRAIRALLAADMIEESAMEEAATVVAAALAIEEAAIEEAADFLAAGE